MYEIEIDGLNQMRLLNTLRNEDVIILRTEFLTPSHMRIAVRRKDLSKGVAILERLCYTYSVKNPLGGETRKKLLWRLPLIITCLLGFVAIFASNFFVWRIEIDGADGAVKMEVVEVINSCGVREFSPKSRVDEKRIVMALRNTDGISSASVTMRGNVLTVSVLTSDEPEPPETGGNVLKSSFDGVITRIVVESGTAIVGVGDTVKRGDALITGELYSTADGSPIGETKVRGSAYAQVTFGYTFPIASSEIVTRTGNCEKRTSIGLFGLTIGGGDPPYPLYETETKKDKLSPLPVEVTHTVYYELSVKEADGEIDDFMHEKGDELYALFGAEFSPRYDIRTVGGVAVIKAYFTAEICIGNI